MAQPDETLGFPTDFDNDGFRRAIKFSMQLGLNPDLDRQPIFLRKGQARTYRKDGQILATPPRLDRDGRPLDPTVEVTREADTQVRVDCAVEITRADAEELPVGNFRPTKATTTLLDVDYAKMKDCRELIYNGDRYLFGFEPESNGLFSVGVYTMIWYCLDDA